MTAATSRLRRRGIGAGVAALVGLSGLGFAAMPAQAAAGFNPAATQVSGVDRFDTAAQIATKAFTTATTVVVANGDRAIDAQAGAYVAGLNNAPILLTQKSNVPTYTVDAIKKLGATKAIVLGDSNSVDATALAQMTAAGLTVTVVAGADRFETAADIYNLGTTKSSTVFLARADLLAGQVSPDALAASPLSYDGTPVLLTNAASLPQATADAIKNGGVKNVVVLGNAITDAVKTAVTALGATVTTIAGDDRSLTAQKIADYGIAQGKYMKTTATIANGDKIDALAAGPWAAKNMAPILLTLGTNSLGTGTTNYLTANASTLTTGVAFGDTNSVPVSLSAAAKTAGGGDVVSNQSLVVGPAAAVTNLVSTTDAANTNRGARTYTATGLDNAKTYSVALVPTANVVVGSTGAVSFKSGSALAGSLGTSIETVNGVANVVAATGAGSTTAANVTPQNGQIAVSVDSVTATSVVPVVFVDANSNGLLDFTTAPTSASPQVPSEAFGVGGAITWNPSEASAGVLAADAPITSVDKTAKQIVTGTATYNYDSNDVFYVGGVAASNQVTLAQFEAVLSAGDKLLKPAASGAVGTSYTTNPAFTSTFVLQNLSPGAPTLNTTPSPADTSAVLTVDPASIVDGATINVYRVAGSLAGTFANATKVTSASVDADSATSGFQVNVTGLTAQTAYTFFVTQTVGGEESAQSAAAPTTTTQSVDASQTLTAVSPGDINNGVGSTTTVLVTYAKALQYTSLTDLGGISVAPTNQSGFSLTATASAVSADKKTVTYELDNNATLDDATTDIPYTVTVAAAAAPSAVGPNGRLTGTFSY
ncbi:cell wall-binding repeat-containing protein [Kineococcus sp. NBC_00420]|uniref:cell wall-binding repeat-containing protein n=1 Tax=Kineococcus sp. NBC_00420 TaxID=2903564 RepID=UPI002E204A17